MAKLDVARHLAGRIRDLRIARQFTQEQVAEAAGIAPNYVSAIERATQSPTIETLTDIADALGVSLSELFLGVDRPLPRELRRVEQALAGRPADVQHAILHIVETALRIAPR